MQTSGNTLTVTLPITFNTAFAGFKGVWLAAQTMGGAQTSPWQALGAEVVPGSTALPSFDGFWSGPTSQGGFVSFAVTANRITFFKINSPVCLAATVGYYDLTSNNQFSLNINTLSVTGDFDSSTAAHGTACGTWTASKL